MSEPSLTIHKERKAGRHAPAETAQIVALDTMLAKEGGQEAWVKRMDTMELPSGTTPYDLSVQQADTVIGFLRADGLGEGVEYRNG